MNIYFKKLFIRLVYKKHTPFSIIASVEEDRSICISDNTVVSWAVRDVGSINIVFRSNK